MSKKNFKEFSKTQTVWKPTNENGAGLKKFQKIIEEKYKVHFNDYWEFHQWTLKNSDQFWEELWEFSGIIFSNMYDKVKEYEDEDSFMTPNWFPGAKLNFAENLLKYRDDRVAMIVAGEDKDTEKVTFREMFEEAQLYAATFRKLGLSNGHLVAAYVSNRKEAIYAMLAAVSIGAIWTGVLPMMGPQAVLNRLQPLAPHFLLTIDRFKMQGQEIEMLSKVKTVVEGLPSLKKVFIIPSTPKSKLIDIRGIENSCFLDDVLKVGYDEDRTVPPMVFEQLDFQKTIFINHTSGTTGLPKAIAHSNGCILSIFRDFGLHFDCTRDSVWLTIAPPDWVAWAACVTLLSMGLTLVVFEGVPYYLTPTYFYDIIDEFEISHMILPGSIIDEFQKKNYVPSSTNHLRSLKAVLSAATVVKSVNFDFVYEKLKKDMIFSSVFGSTEFLSCCFVFESTLPVYKEEIPALALGVDLQVLNEEGNPVEGELGDLVIAQPMPNLPIGIWKDNSVSQSIYKEIYFSKYKGKFAFGDCGVLNPVTKGLRIYCRSDETLKQRGCRFGSSEIYTVVEMFSSVQDSLCVAQINEAKDARAVLFLKMKEGCIFSEEFSTAVKEAIAKELTPRHVPDVILEIGDIPYNANGKKLEIIVKKIINKMPYSVGTIQNPKALELYINIPELQGY